jgi:hypothetical protein
MAVLLRQSYNTAPASLAWAILGSRSDGSYTKSLDFVFPRSAVVVASLRYLGTVHFKAEAFTASEDEAKRLTEQLNAFLKIFQAIDINGPVQSSDPDIKQFFDNLKIEQHRDRAVLTTIVPHGFIRKAFAEPPNSSEKTPTENSPPSDSQRQPK